jgi:hypothetical protein
MVVSDGLLVAKPNWLIPPQTAGSGSVIDRGPTARMGQGACGGHLLATCK